MIEPPQRRKTFACDRLARWVALLATAGAILPQAVLADGQIDTSFGTGGRITLSHKVSSGVEVANSILLLGDGRFVSAGAGGGFGIWITQHGPNGLLDSGFGTGGTTYFELPNYSFAASALRQPDGKIVTAGGTNVGGSFDTLVDRLTPQGSLDPMFGNDPPNPTGDGISSFNLGADDLAYDLVLDSTGKIVVVGRAGPNLAHDVLLARFNEDGSVDNAFGGATGVHTDLGGDEIGEDIAMQGDRIVVLVKQGAKTMVLRYMPDGSLDKSFGGGDGLVDVSFPSGTSPNDVLVQPDGRIVVIGDEAVHAWLARLLPDGSPDPSYGSGGLTSITAPASANSFSISSVAESDDGKVIAVGTTFNSARIAVIRTLANGLPDPAWGTNGFVGIDQPDSSIGEYGYSLAVQPDRRIIIGGEYFANLNDDRLVTRLLGDTTPPDTVIVRSPKNNGKPRRKAKFAFEARDDVNTTFQCALKRPTRHRHRHSHARPKAKAPAFSKCTSPLTVKNLRRPGRYKLFVRSIDPAGNVDPSPAHASLRVHKPHRG